MCSTTMTHSWNVRGSGLSNTCRSNVIITFVDSGVNSFKHAVEVKQITFGAGVSHWR